MRTEELLFINAYIGLNLPMAFCMELVGEDQYAHDDYEEYLGCFFWDVNVPSNYVAPGTDLRATYVGNYKRAFFVEPV